MTKPLLPYANNKGADQPARPCSLISAFVVHYVDSIIPILAKSEISRLADLCSWAGWFESYLVGDPEDRFSCDEARMFFFFFFFFGFFFFFFFFFLLFWVFQYLTLVSSYWLKNYWKCSLILNSITRFLSSLPKPAKWLYTHRRLRSAWASCNCCQNQQNDLCAQPRLRSAWTSTQSDQSIRCPHEESLGTWLSLAHTAKTGWMPRLIRVFARNTGHFVGFVMRRLILCKLYMSVKLLLFSVMSEW